MTIVAGGHGYKLRHEIVQLFTRSLGEAAKKFCFSGPATKRRGGGKCGATKKITIFEARNKKLKKNAVLVAGRIKKDFFCDFP